MKVDKDPNDSALKEASRGLAPLLLIACAVLVVAAAFYFGLGGGTAEA